MGAARPWRDVAPSLDVLGMWDALEQLLAITAEMERAGSVWMPNADDVWRTPEGKLFASTARSVPHRPDRRVNAREVLTTLGAALVPEPAMRAAPRLMHHLLPSCIASERWWNVDELRFELADIRKETASVDRRARCVGHTDAGLRHDGNEDAFAIGRGHVGRDPWYVLVVCDGVSSSRGAARASSVAAAAAHDALCAFARSAEFTAALIPRAVGDAVRLAHRAVCDMAAEEMYDDGSLQDPPGTTIVAALVYRGRLVVGWLGDSRAYWIGPTACELVTEDDSWIVETVRAGEMTEEQATASHLAHALTKCIGPLEVGDDPADVEPHVVSRELTEAGYVLLCSDGLWNYAPKASQLATLMRERPSPTCAQPSPVEMPSERSPDEIARDLVGYALSLGGIDNVTVALLAHDPS